MVGKHIVFTGSEPYEVEDLFHLLPLHCAWVDPANIRPADILVIGFDGFSEDVISRCLEHSSELAILPQEGFIDLVMFGYDWWHDFPQSLNRVLEFHPGLQYAKSREMFVWPSTEQKETRNPGVARDGFRDETPLHRMGYRITDGRGGYHSAAYRWDMLKSKAVPRLGLKEVANTIAQLCRARRSQSGGENRYKRALREWESDLARLKAEYYDGNFLNFAWPTTKSD